MSKQNKIIQLIYASAAKYDFDNTDLHVLLEKCRRENRKNGISGMLLYQNQSFFQVLEGTKEDVERVYKKICADPRHHKVLKVIESEVEERAFSDWSVAHAKVDRNDLARIEGINDFFFNKRQFTELDADRAHKILMAFSNGEWREELR